MNTNKEWIEAKNKFHLSDMHIQMAKELGMNPKKFGGLLIINKRNESYHYQILLKSYILRDLKKRSQM